MEIKKSDKASLDNRRTTGFLLGLIFVLSVCYVGLEFTSNVDDGNSTADTFDDMSEDIEMLPAMDTHDMIAAAPVAAPSVTEKLKPVDTDPDISQLLINLRDLRLAYPLLFFIIHLPSPRFLSVILS